MKALRFLPPIVWTGVVAWLSGEAWSAEGTSFLIPFIATLVPSADPDQLRAGLWLLRKAAHAAEYGVLGGLWWWALAREAPARWPVALGLAALTAAGDEFHQTATFSRTGSVVDVLLDSAGASVAIALLRSGRAGIDRITGVLLWTAAVAGTALIALDWVVRAPAGWLWVSVPAAWLALVLWRRKPRRA